MKNLKEKYNKEVIPEMKKKLGLKNTLQVPRIEKVVINAGVGKYLKDSNMVKEAVKSIELITGQRPVLTKSRKSIAGFKIRQGLEIGIKTTLRGRRSWDFMEKLVSASIPRVRDFQGIKETSVDESGNMNIGIKEHTVFPEILPEDVKNIMSLQINIATTAKNRERGIELFRLLGFPLKSDKQA